jgi:hypothetical protein
VARRRWAAALLLLTVVLGACTSDSPDAAPEKTSPSPPTLSLDELSDGTLELCPDVVDAYEAVVTEKNLTRLGAKLGKFRVAVRDFTKEIEKFNLSPDIEKIVNPYLRLLQKLVEASRDALGHTNRKPKETLRAFTLLGKVQLNLLEAREHARLPIECELATAQDALFNQFLGKALSDCLQATQRLNKEAPDGLPSTPSEGVALYQALASSYHSLADDLRDDIPPHLSEAKKIERVTELADQIGAAFDRAVGAINALSIGSLEAAVEDAEDLAAQAIKLSKDVALDDCAGAFFT